MNTINSPRRHSGARRLALLSAASGAAIALGGSLGVPPARAAISAAARPPDQAAAPAFVRPMAQALTHVNSYQITAQSASSGDGKPVAATSTAIVLRRGPTLRLHLTTTARRAGQASALEEVLTGAHACVRLSRQRAWSCAAAPTGALTGLRSLDPARLARAIALGRRFVPLGPQIHQGRTCLGYRFTVSAGSLRSEGTLWIARATALPVEEDAGSSVTVRRGAAPLVVRTTQRWSRWNDPRLIVPSVPAS